MSWNKVLEFIKELKEEVKEKNNGNLDYSYKEGETCVERWVKECDNQEWKELMNYMVTNQLGNLVLFHYGRFTEVFGSISPLNFWNYKSGFFRQCRGLVIDVENEELILTPYDKFFNIDEIPGWEKRVIEDKIKVAETVEFSDKMDGSMQSYRVMSDGKFYSAGSQAVDENLSIRVREGRKLFFLDPAYYKMCADYPGYTFIFEFISPDIDPHIVIYPKEKTGLWLTGMREVETGELFGYKETMEIADKYGVKHTELYKLNLEDAYNALDKYKSNEKEGLVINIDGFRAKLKYNDFLGVHKILSRLTSPNPILEAIVNETYDDLISRIPSAYIPRVEEIKDDILSKFNDIRNIVISEYDQVEKIEFETFGEKMRYINKNCKFSGLVIEWIKTGKMPDITKLVKRGNTVCKYSHLKKLWE